MINTSKRRLIIDGSSGFLGQSIFNYFIQKNNYQLTKLNREISPPICRKRKYILIIATGLFNGSITDLVNSNILRPLEVITKLDKVISKVILLSSGAVYGSKYNSPRSMENDMLNPYDIYSSTKSSIEKLIQLYVSDKNLPLTILRLPIVYSANNLKGVLPNMISSYSKNRSITVYDKGKSVRDFLHYEDFLFALNNIIELDIRGIYNISSEATYSMLELASIIVNKKSEIIISDKKPNALEKLSLNYSKASNDFSFKPKINSLSELDLFSLYGFKK
tara:strand:+ start:53434 stop:54264 length:831 start_codon:yes stop_codon:yes gene_type:complete